jgi:hypothetical protein
MSRASSSSLVVRSARTSEPDAAAAVGEIVEALSASDASAVLLFCSPGYELTQLGRALKQSFSVPISACTTTSQFGPSGFETGGITAVALWGSDLTMTPTLLPNISSASFGLDVSRLRIRGKTRRKAFGVLFSDGLSCAEEYLAASIYQALGDVPVVGGSAVDGDRLTPAAVYHSGRFHSDAAVLSLFETDAVPFATFQAQCFRPTPDRVVTTLADPDRRIIYELNGEPAVTAYAEALGVDPRRLDANGCAERPLMLKVGERFYIRSVKSCNADQSLTLFCAIEEGLVLSIGEAKDPLTTLQSAFDALPNELERADLVLAFDTCLDRTRLGSQARRDAVSDLLSEKGVRGFSGYGSQLGPVHLNQTLVGIAIGGSRSDEARPR